MKDPNVFDIDDNEFERINEEKECGEVPNSDDIIIEKREDFTEMACDYVCFGETVFRITKGMLKYDEEIDEKYEEMNEL